MEINKEFATVLIIVSIVVIGTLLAIEKYFYGNYETVKINLYIKDHKFEPEVIYGKENTRIKLRIFNLDDSMEEFESHELNREKIIPGKSDILLQLPPLKAGTYSFFGDFHQDSAKGKLIIEKANN